MKLRMLLGLFAVLLLIAACVPIPQSAPPAAAPEATAAPPVSAGSGWQTYTNDEAGFSISYPGSWRQEDLPPTQTTHGVSLDGPEGTLELYWGTGFGGACPGGYSTVKVADGELPVCHTVDANGIQRWEQINKELATTSFSGRAFTKDAAQASADAVLAVLATLAFEQPLPSVSGQAGAQGSTLAPPAPEVCNGMAQALAEALSRAATPPGPVEVTQATEPVTMTAPMPDWTTVATGTGCRAMAKGTGEQFASPSAIMNEISAVLTSGGWEEDKQQMGAGGPTAEGWGFRSGNLLSMALAGWSPDPSANCPKDKPTPECPLTPAQKLYNITLDTAQAAAPAAALGTTRAVVQGAAPAPAAAGSPAAQNCINVGGKPATETLPDGGQYGVCYFGDNYVCEQWALMHGDCPVGGVKVSGLNTPAARYCEITGGDYMPIGVTNTGEEAGNCTLPSGKVCDAGDYYKGHCSSSSPQPAPPPTAAPIGKPNPASQTCAALGGTSRIEARGDGAQYSVCYFADNKQCEEWAMMQGYCPAGGVKVTGYNTPAARYCAITGGKYTPTGTTPDGYEAGDCLLPSGETCYVWAYYNGVCG